MEKVIALQASCYVRLKAGGEICNRLKKGARVLPVQRKGDWLKITWRGGKKKGWICLPEAGFDSPCEKLKNPEPNGPGFSVAKG